MCIEVYRSSRSEVLCNFIKKETVNLSNFLITPIFIEQLRWLLLELTKPFSTSMETCFFIINTSLK